PMVTLSAPVVTRMPSRALANGVLPLVPILNPWIRVEEALAPLTWMPLPLLPAMTLLAPCRLPRMLTSAPRTWMPSPPLPRAAVWAAFRPMTLLLTVVESVLTSMLMPFWALPEMTLAEPASVPPMVMPLALPVMLMPLPALAAACRPPWSRPMV